MENNTLERNQLIKLDDSLRPIGDPRPDISLFTVICKLSCKNEHVENEEISESHIFFVFHTRTHRFNNLKNIYVENIDFIF